jgi:hypothetical protein
MLPKAKNQKTDKGNSFFRKFKIIRMIEYINYCDNCRRWCDIIYVDEKTGLELCAECLNDLNDVDDYDDDLEYEYDDDD